MSGQYYLDSLRRDVGDPSVNVESLWARPLLWSCVMALCALLVWASWATVSEISRGQGRVITSSRQQSIQSLEGGIIAAILVREGQEVAAGEALVNLDQTRFQSAFRESSSKARGLKASIARLEAEVFGAESVTFPAELDTEAAEINTENKLFLARRQRLQAATSAIEQERAATREQLDVLQPLVAARAVGEIEMLRLRREMAAMEGRLTELKNSFVQEAYTELALKKAELSGLEQILVQRSDQLKRTLLVSPVNGVVNNISITTRGGVVAPGEEIMQITPLAEQLLIETRLLPQDVAFVAPGMPATVKVSAYNYAVYGGLSGKVVQISPDTLEEQTERGTETFYKVQVKTEQNWLQRGEERLPIKPGMVAVVDIQTGERSVLSYLLRPFTRLELR